MTELVLAHTGQLAPAVLDAAHRMLVDVFGDRFDDADWQHALGGLHTMVWDGAVLIGHAALVQRTLVHADRPCRAGYVEAVAVRPEARGRGVAATMMATLERLAANAYELAALSASHQAVPLYRGRGWLEWRGTLSVLGPHGPTPLPDEDGVYVLPLSAPLDLDGDLACDWRIGDVW